MAEIGNCADDNQVGLVLPTPIFVSWQCLDGSGWVWCFWFWIDTVTSLLFPAQAVQASTTPGAAGHALSLHHSCKDNVHRPASQDWTIEVCVLMVDRSIKGNRVETWKFFSWTEHQPQQCGATPFPVSQSAQHLALLRLCWLFCRHGVQDSVCFGEAMWSYVKLCEACQVMSGMSIYKVCKVWIWMASAARNRTWPEVPRNAGRSFSSCKGSDKTCGRHKAWVDTVDENSLHAVLMATLGEEGTA